MIVTWCFSYWQIFAKFQPEKYDFGLSIQKIFHGKNGPNLPNFELKKNSKSPESYDNLQKVAKNIEGLCVCVCVCVCVFFFCPTFISSM
jgi:hypothetical protein